MINNLRTLCICGGVVIYSIAMIAFFIYAIIKFRA